MMKNKRFLKRFLTIFLAVWLVGVLAGCGTSAEGNLPTGKPNPTESLPTVLSPQETLAPTPSPTTTPTPSPTTTPTETLAPTPTPTTSPQETLAPTPMPTTAPAETLAPTETMEPFVIVLDPGHQKKSNQELEPNGPGSDTMKAKVSSGTVGVSTKLPEHELNLTVALYLRDELLKRGYKVIMIRETADVNISNAERATIANEANADAFIRIHGNGAANAAVKGVETLCQTKNNPYNGELYEESRRLSELIVEEVVAATGAKDRGVKETDTMTGINWAQVPSTILEMGFMTNEEEDKLLATEEYQKKIVQGVADALDRFLGRE